MRKICSITFGIVLRVTKQLDVGVSFLSTWRMHMAAASSSHQKDPAVAPAFQGHKEQPQDDVRVSPAYSQT